MVEPFINIDIELGNDRTVNLQIDREEEIESTLKEFCDFYNLDSRVHQTIMEQIIHNINSAAEAEHEELPQNNSEERSNDDEDDIYSNTKNKVDSSNYQLNDTSKINDLPNKPKDKVSYCDWKNVSQTRLNQTNITKKNVTDTSNIDKSVSIKTTLNPRKDFRGLLLYNRHLDQKERKLSHNKHVKEMQKTQEMKNVTFQPKLDSKSRILAQKIQHPNYKVEERLLTYGKETSLKQMKEQAKKIIKDNDFSYQPVLTEKSVVIASIIKKKRDDLMKDRSFANKTFDSKDVNNLSFDETKTKADLTKLVKTPTHDKTSCKSSDKYSFSNMRREKSSEKEKEKENKDKSVIKNPSYIHDFLFEDAKLKEEKRQKFQKKWMDINCSFKPFVSEMSKSLIKKEENMNEFLKRMMNSKKETEELLVEVRQKESRKGELNKSKTSKIVGKIDRSINLDSHYDKKLLDKKNQIQSEEIVNNLEKKKHWLENSMKIVIKMKIDKYKEIFDLLDHDKDGFISAKSIKLSNLTTDLLETLTPLLEEIQTKNLSLNFKDFCVIGDKILKMKIFHNSSD